MAVQFISSAENRPKLDLELCCGLYVVHSAASALYLDFLHRRYPAMLVPPPRDDDALDAVADGFAFLQNILDRIRDRLQAAQLPPDLPCRERFRLSSDQVLHELSELTKRLANMMGAAVLSISARLFPRDCKETKRSLDCQPWLRVTVIVCYGERGCIDLIETISTASLPNVGHRIATMIATHDVDEQGRFYQSCCCVACRHTPRGQSVAEDFMFISPAEVLGKDHPVSLVTERVALAGDAAQVGAVDSQRRIDWLETAVEYDMPLRTICYSNEASDCAVVFNLFSKSEADRLGHAGAAGGDGRKVRGNPRRLASHSI